MLGTATPQDGHISVAANISNHVVHLMSEFTGRGPTKARTSIDDDLISVVLRETLTKGERTLVADGNSQLVLRTRKAYQDAMRMDLIEGVERLTGRTVIALLSDNHLDPDIAVESFVLSPAVLIAADAQVGLGNGDGGT